MEKDKEELLKKWEEEDKEYRKIRIENADWNFIEKQEPRIKNALKYYVKTGNIRFSARLAGVSLEKMNELRIKANIPWIT
ncbi:MAG: hypothetical protein ACE5J9_05795 [Methanosarcinales archaeon]